MRYTVQAAARATGISEHRLRTWERRYGIPAPARSTTGRRLYSDDDLGVIRAMARLVDAGIPASEAARAALGATRQAPITMLTAETHPTVTRLLDAARAFDPGALEQDLTAAFDELGDAAAVSDVVMPFLRDVGDRWEDAEMTVAQEHFASEVVRRVLSCRATAMGSPPAGAPTLVMACPAGEGHDLGLLALSLLVRAAGIRTIYLGADVPPDDLLAACEAADADAVALVATTATSLPTLRLTARRFFESRVRCRVFVGGRALANAAEDDLVIGERLPAALAEAATWMANALVEAP